MDFVSGYGLALDARARDSLSIAKAKRRQCTRRTKEYYDTCTHGSESMYEGNDSSELWCEERSECSDFRAEHGTYKLSVEQERDAILMYQRKLRLERVLQVREQEMLLAAQGAGEYRQRRKRESLKLLQKLKEFWQEEQAKRRAALEFDYLHSCKGIGQSHDMAQCLTAKSRAEAEQRAKEVEVHGVRRNLRFQRAVQEVKAGRLEVSQEKIFARCRRKVFSEVSATERRRARNYASRTKSKDDKDERKIINTATKEDGPEKYLRIDCRLNCIHYQLPGAPRDYKDTYFHSRFTSLKDQATRRTVVADKDDIEAVIDAWEAAEALVKIVEKDKQHLEKLWRRRKAERVRAA